MVINKMQKFMNNKKKGIRYFFILYLYTLVYSSQTLFFMILEIFIVTRLKKKV